MNINEGKLKQKYKVLAECLKTLNVREFQHSTGF